LFMQTNGASSPSSAALCASVDSGSVSAVPYRNYASATETLIVVAVVLLFTVLLTWPLARNVNTNAVDVGDGLLTAYIQAWDVHALTTSPRQLFNMNTFYPAKNTLARSENLLGNLPLFAPAYFISGNANFANNIVILSSFVLCGVGMYMLVKFATRDYYAAGIAGFIFAFSPVRILQIGHMQLLNFEWAPLAVLALLLALQTRRKRYLVLSTALLFLQALCSVYLAFFVVVVLAAYVAGALLVRPTLFRGMALNIVLAALCFGALLAPLVAQYRKVNKAGVFNTDISFMVSASANPIGSYLDVGTGTGRNIYAPLLQKYVSAEFDWEKNLFPGFVALFLAACGISGWFRAVLRRGRATEREVGWSMPLLLVATGSMVLLVASYVLSLGPYLRVHDQPTHIPLPFLWAAKLLPGFAGIRVPARFGFVAMLALSTLAGCGWLTICNWLHRFRLFARPVTVAIATAGLLAVMALEYRFVPLNTFPVITPATLAPEYRWLAGRPKGSVTLELPISGPIPVGDPFEQAQYVYASTYHWQPLVNGYTGYPPPSAWQTLPVLAHLPERSSLELLHQLRVRYVVLHTDKITPERAGKWATLPSDSGLKVAARFGPTTVFEVTPTRSSSAQ
jgi:hypothetical protein